MAYDERLAARTRKVLARKKTEEKSMFGGVAFLVRGRMACGIIKNDLCVRVGAEAYPSAVKRPNARPMTFTGKALRSMVYVAPGGTRSDASLRDWVERGVSFVESLPAKSGGGKSRAKTNPTGARKAAKQRQAKSSTAGGAAKKRQAKSSTAGGAAKKRQATSPARAPAKKRQSKSAGVRTMKRKATSRGAAKPARRAAKAKKRAKRR